MFRWLKSLAADSNFRNCTILSDTQLLERYDMDLALRFITLRAVSGNDIGDVHEFLRDRMEEIATQKSYDFSAEKLLFQEVFKFLEETTGSDSFRSWNTLRSDFRGGFSLGAFEGIAITLGKHWPKIKKMGKKFDALQFVKDVWSQPEYTKSFSGLRARERMARVLPAAERVVQQHIKTTIKTTSAKKKVAAKKKV